MTQHAPLIIDAAGTTLSAADRRHVHHLLIGLGLNPRQAALTLYSFSGFLCGAVMLGVAALIAVIWLMLVLNVALTVAGHRYYLQTLKDDVLFSPAVFPFVSVLVPAHNESRVIGNTVRALLRFDYPPVPDGFSFQGRQSRRNGSAGGLRQAFH